MKPLQNVGASCFINTVLQSLFASKQFNKVLISQLQTNKESVLSNPVLGPYCVLSKSLVNDQFVKVGDFVSAVRKHNSRWEGMCDSFEFLEYLIDQLEEMAGVNLLAIRQIVRYNLECGHVGVIEDKETIENYLY